MKRKILRGITTVLSLVMAFSVLGNTKVKAAGNVIVNSVVANTYVADQGQMVDSFEITVDDINKVQGLKAEDFDITNNYDGYPLDENSALRKDSYADDGITLNISGNTIKLDVKDFKYDSSLNGVFNVASAKYPELSFTSTNVTKVNTRTVDKFQKLTFTGSNGVTIPYRLYLTDTGRPEPLVIWMHGSGEVGTDNVKPVTASRGAVAWVEEGYNTNVIAAQYPYKFSVDLSDKELQDMKAYFKAYVELINKLVAEGKVDKDRIYLTGASMGGGLTLRFLLEDPDMFAGSVAIASRGTVKDLSELKSISNLPIWLFHADEDLTNSSSISKNIYNELQNLGNKNSKLTIYSTETMNSLRLYGGLRHWSWVPTLNNKEMMSWLFSQSKRSKAVVKDITANTYVADQGQMVNSFEITVDDINKVANLRAQDFDITNNYDGYPLDEKGSLRKDSYVDDGISITVSGNTIKMDVKDFKYDSSLTGVFKVTSTIYPELSFTSSNVSKLNTQTVDKFQKLTFTGSNGVTIPYRLFLTNTGKAEPLVIWMHGSGEVGTDNVKHITASRGAVAWVEEGYTTNVIAAQYPYKFSVELNDKELQDMKAYFKAYTELINKLVAEGKVDKDRIYLTGASMGGGLSLRFMLEKPDLFAGVVAIASRGTVKDLSELKAVSNLPIWLFHAEEDPTNSSTISKNIYNELQNLGNKNAKLTIYSTETMSSLRLYGPLRHWSWVPTLNNKEVMSWLFSQKKVSNVVTPTTQTTKTTTNTISVLPKTGSGFDTNILVVLGIMLVGSGAILARRVSKKTNA